jgi:SPP1 family predicted phage head-tail adaptor
MQIGKLRKRIVIQESMETRDDIGGTAQSWNALGSTWGDVRLVPGFDTREQFVEGANRIIATATHTVTMRYSEMSVMITPGMRILVESKTFEVESVGDVDGRRAVIIARCKEIVL